MFVICCLEVGLLCFSLSLTFLFDPVLFDNDNSVTVAMTSAAQFKKKNWIAFFQTVHYACSRRCQPALDLTVQGTGHLHPPPCTATFSLCLFFFWLLAAKVRSSCEEGPGQSALQSAYHDPHLDVTEWKQNRTT